MDVSSLRLPIPAPKNEEVVHLANKSSAMLTKISFENSSMDYQNMSLIMDDLLGKKKKNLKPGLNIAKIYRQYIMKCIEKGRQVVSNHKFREIFNTEVNLAFKRRHTDTCKTCDAFNAAL